MMLASRLKTSLIRTCLIALTAMTACVDHAQSEPATNQLPSGAAVVGGSAAISQSGTAQAPVMTVQQNSDRAILNWNSFNIGREASVVFKQPDAESAILNRVLDANPSQIFGKLQANGQVFIMNPAGVWFGKDANVDVGALFATTHSISNDGFMAGAMRFERNGSTGRVLNEGSLAAKLGGYIALLAPEVRNDGLLLAQSGTIMLAAGEVATLNFDPANSKVDLLVEPSRVNALIENRRLVKAPDGKVVVSAQAYNNLAAGVIRNSGEVVATGMQSVGGKIILGASTEVANSGTLDTSSRVADAGSVRIQADRVNNSGVVNVESTALRGQGGEVLIKGRELSLTDTAKIQASGTLGGGTVMLSGEGRGWGDEPEATRVMMKSGAAINASAVRLGDGGKVVLKTDTGNKNATTAVAGSITAKAGNDGGDGGQIETSGFSLYIEGLRVDATAANGQVGQWFINTHNLQIGPTTITTESASLLFNTGSIDLSKKKNIPFRKSSELITEPASDESANDSATSSAKTTQASETTEQQSKCGASSDPCSADANATAETTTAATTTAATTTAATTTAATTTAETTTAQLNSNQLPTDGKIVAGSATVSQSGTAEIPVLTVEQSSDRAIFNWNSFNVGPDASLVFKQPTVTSAVLIKNLLDTSPMQIFGGL